MDEEVEEEVQLTAVIYFYIYYYICRLFFDPENVHPFSTEGFSTLLKHF